MQRALDVEALTDLRKIIDIIPEWELLAAQDPAQGFFRRPAWYLSWLENFFSAATPLVILVRDGGTVVGIAPLCIVQRGIRRTVKFGGCDIVCGDYLDFITLPEYRTRVSQHIFRYLTDVAPKWDDLMLDGVSTTSTLLAELGEWTSERKFMLRANGNRTICPYINLPASFDGYLSRLKRKRKKDFVRVMRRSHENGLAIKAYKTAQELQAAIDTLIRLHQLRWNSAGQPGLLGRRGFRGFLNQLARLEESSATFRLYVMEDAGTPIAALLNFHYGSTAFHYQNGFDPHCRFASYAPGTLLILHGIQAAIQEGLSTYDFLRGQEAYKFQFTDQYRSIDSFLVGQTILGKAFLLARDARRAAAGLKSSRRDSTVHLARKHPVPAHNG